VAIVKKNIPTNLFIKRLIWTLPCSQLLSPMVRTSLPNILEEGLNSSVDISDELIF
jgi:hypothetical protein